MLRETLLAPGSCLLPTRRRIARAVSLADTALARKELD